MSLCRSIVEDALYKAVCDIESGSALLAAVSGGADSTALLCALSGIAHEKAFHVYCVHIQHNLRGGEGVRDERAVDALCAAFKIPFVLRAAAEGEITELAKKKGCGIEAAARDIRHKLLREEAELRGAQHILIAHTKDDRLETVLMRLLKGSGPAGLSPMPMRKGKVLRPFINLCREDILNYLSEKNISYCIDSTNASSVYLRNRVRHFLIPVLKTNFAGWENNLLEMAETQKIISRYIYKRATKIIKRSFKEQPEARAKAQGKSFYIRDFFTLPQALKEEIVFRIIDRINKADYRVKGEGGGVQSYFEADAKQQKERTNKRRVLRRALIEQKNAELKDVRLEPKGKDLIVKKKKSYEMEHGFSVLIKDEGCYHAGALTIQCKKEGEGYLFAIHGKP